MRTRWRVVLAVASGIAVLGLLLPTDTVLDPYLPDINPDIYLWAGGILAALLGGLVGTLAILTYKALPYLLFGLPAVVGFRAMTRRRGPGSPPGHWRRGRRPGN